jgi:ssDNA thymidine ADP-ribosyltransferase, DarT
MPAPFPTRLFHITAAANLPAILAAGALLSKNSGAAVGINYQNIAHAGAQGARSVKSVTGPPGGTIHDYVPFYFAPRSPMLLAINSGRVVGCPWRQADIVHFETTVQKVIALPQPFVFYDRNATLAFSKPYTSLEDLDTAVAWDLITEAPQLDGFCKYFHNIPTNSRYLDRMERRQAEFLVRERVLLSSFTRLGVIDSTRKAHIEGLCKQLGINLSVHVMPSWYF